MRIKFDSLIICRTYFGEMHNGVILSMNESNVPSMVSLDRPGQKKNGGPNLICCSIRVIEMHNTLCGTVEHLVTSD